MALPARCPCWRNRSRSPITASATWKNGWRVNNYGYFCIWAEHRCSHHRAVLSRWRGRENHAAGQQVHTDHLRRHWPCAWPCSPVCGHAGVPGNGPHHGGSCRRGIRPCGHRHQSGCKAAWQN